MDEHFFARDVVAVAADLAGGERYALLLERGLDPGLQGRIDLRTAVGGDLHGRILRVHVGQRVDEAQRQHQQERRP